MKKRRRADPARDMRTRRAAFWRLEQMALDPDAAQWRRTNTLR